jgi:putative aldouronate transport system permease protein
MARLTINQAPLYFRVANGVFLSVMALTMVIPVWNILVTSFSTDWDSYSVGIRFLPARPSLSGYVALMATARIWRPYLNNLIVTVCGVAGHLCLNCLAGFVLVRPSFPGKRLVWLFILIPLFVPFESIIIPRYLVYKELGLIDTLASVTINGMVSTASIFLLRNFLSNIPRELVDSAEIDGAKLLTILGRIYLPLSTAALATIGLFETVGKWNHLFSAVLFLHTPSKYTLQMALRNLVVEQSSAFASGVHVHNNARAAGVAMALLPMVLVYPFLQRYFIKGLFIGAVKG